jgi:hypothetical protein
MKLQFEGQKLRLRIDEDELAGLLAGASVHAHTRVADAFEMACTVRLSEASDASIEGAVGDWFVHLPQALVAAHAIADARWLVVRGRRARCGEQSLAAIRCRRARQRAAAQGITRIIGRAQT